MGAAIRLNMLAPTALALILQRFSELFYVDAEAVAAKFRSERPSMGAAVEEVNRIRAMAKEVRRILPAGGVARLGAFAVDVSTVRSDLLANAEAITGALVASITAECVRTCRALDVYMEAYHTALEHEPETTEDFAELRRQLDLFGANMAHAKRVLHQVKEWVDGLWSVKALLPLDDEVHVWRCRAWPKWLSEMCDRTAERLPHLLRHFERALETQKETFSKQMVDLNQEVNTLTTYGDENWDAAEGFAESINEVQQRLSPAAFPILFKGDEIWHR